MKAHLMFSDGDFLALEDIPRHDHYRSASGVPALSPNTTALVQDLAIDTLVHAMAGEDTLIRDIARMSLLSATGNAKETILYRQAVLKDCQKFPDVVRQLYALTTETIDKKRKSWWSLSSHFPAAVLNGAVELMQMLLLQLRQLRRFADAYAESFESEGFVSLFAMIRTELGDEYLATVETHLADLRFRRGVLESAKIGRDGAGIAHVLRHARDQGPGWFAKMLGRASPAYTFQLHPRDEAGARIVTELRDRGINAVGNALAQAADHVLGFFEMLRVELAFYVGCLNLHDALAAMDAPMAFPMPRDAGAPGFECRNMYDMSLALSMGHVVVGNTIHANGKGLVIVTGANQGGKSSFLRGAGLAQLMMQCGMFVGAEGFGGAMCAALFTHYKREEDASMKGGKLDEELARMSLIADALRPHAMVLFNESFASTNEREGSEIARQVVRALRVRNITVFFVTHLYDFAITAGAIAPNDTIYLRACREADGSRTFRLVEAEPLATSYGRDLYRRIFADDASSATIAQDPESSPVTADGERE